MRNGIILNGVQIPIETVPDLVNFLAAQIADVIISKTAASSSAKMPPKLYSAKEIASQLNRSVSTITRHASIGLLRGKKVGKSWLFTEENYHLYKFGKSDIT